VVPGWFTPDVAVQESLRGALWVLVITQPVAGYVFVLDGVLMGAGDAPYLAKAGALIAVAVMPAAIAVAWWSPEGPLGLAMLWLACNFLFMVLRAISLGLRVRTDAWMRLATEQRRRERPRVRPRTGPCRALRSPVAPCPAAPGRAAQPPWTAAREATKARTAVSMSSSVWAAESCTRIRALSCGTTG